MATGANHVRGVASGKAGHRHCPILQTDTVCLATLYAPAFGPGPAQAPRTPSRSQMREFAVKVASDATSLVLYCIEKTYTVACLNVVMDFKLF